MELEILNSTIDDDGDQVFSFEHCVAAAGPRSEELILADAKKRAADYLKEMDIRKAANRLHGRGFK